MILAPYQTLRAAGGAEGNRTPDLCSAIAPSPQIYLGFLLGTTGVAREQLENIGQFAVPVRSQPDLSILSISPEDAVRGVRFMFESPPCRPWSGKAVRA